jgi:hypothetical protein
MLLLVTGRMEMKPTLQDEMVKIDHSLLHAKNQKK